MMQPHTIIASAKNRRYAHIWTYCAKRNILEASSHRIQEDDAITRDARCITAHTIGGADSGPRSHYKYRCPSVPQVSSRPALFIRTLKIPERVLTKYTNQNIYLF